MISRLKIMFVFFFGFFLLSLIAPAGISFAQSQPDKPVVVSNPEEPALPPGKRLKIVFKEELSIGVEEGDENYMFGRSIQATADEKGSIYVLDWGKKKIQKFDPSGKFLFSIGRQGQGPGEFGNLWEMRFDKKGRIYITDIVNKRVSFFDKETGNFQDAIKSGVDGGAVILLSNGTYFASTNSHEDTANGRIFTIPYGIFDRDFKMIAELKRDKLDFSNLPAPSDRAKFVAGILSQGAYKPHVATAVAEDERIIVGYSERYEIDVYDITGKSRLRILKAGEPHAVTERHKDYYFESSVLDFLSTSTPRPKDEDVRKAMVYPKFLPAYLTFIPMDNGFLFVVTEALADTSTVDLFDSKGVYVGRFTTPVPAATLVFKNGKAYGVAEIGDYMYVKRYAYTIQKY